MHASKVQYVGVRVCGFSASLQLYSSDPWLVTVVHADRYVIADRDYRRDLTLIALCILL